MSKSRVAGDLEQIHGSRADALVAQPFSLGPPNPVVTCSSEFLYVRVSQNQYH